MLAIVFNHFRKLGQGKIWHFSHLKRKKAFQNPQSANREKTPSFKQRSPELAQHTKEIKAQPKQELLDQRRLLQQEVKLCVHIGHGKKNLCPSSREGKSRINSHFKTLQLEGLFSKMDLAARKRSL